jgi:hypothetical protein
MKEISRRLVLAVLLQGLVMLSYSDAFARDKKNQAAANPAPGKAVVFVYRHPRALGKIATPMIFVGGRLLTDKLHDHEYAFMEVPAGTIVVTAFAASAGKGWGNSSLYDSRHFVMPSATGGWASLPGCSEIAWDKMAVVPGADWSSLTGSLDTTAVLRCQAGLITMERECSGKNKHSPECSEKEGGLGSALQLVGLSETAYRIQITAQEGKSHYVEYEIKASGKTLRPVDDADGAKEVNKLHLVKD